MPDKPNILWIYGEDLYPNLACYGTPAVQTPNIDKLASEGTLFTNAFVTCPVCSPSRSAIITGRYQTSFGAHNHRSKRDTPLPEHIRLITDYFRDAGYYTCNSPGPPFDKPGKTDFNFQRNGVFDGIDWTQRAGGPALLRPEQHHRHPSQLHARPAKPRRSRRRRDPALLSRSPPHQKRLGHVSRKCSGL